MSLPWTAPEWLRWLILPFALRVVYGLYQLGVWVGRRAGRQTAPSNLDGIRSELCEAFGFMSSVEELRRRVGMLQALESSGLASGAELGRLAFYLLNLGDAEEAIAAWQRAMAAGLQPRLAEWFFAECLMDHGRTEEATAMFRRFLEGFATSSECPLDRRSLAQIIQVQFEAHPPGTVPDWLRDMARDAP